LREDLVEAVRVLECLLEAGGHHEPQNPCLVDSEEGVWNVPGEVDERARLGAKSLLAAQDLDRPAEHVETLVLVPVDVERGAVATRNHRLYHAKRTAGVAATCLDRAGGIAGHWPTDRIPRLGSSRQMG
jgi:hypothetical protein